jgi:hypothetical protein
MRGGIVAKSPIPKDTNPSRPQSGIRKMGPRGSLQASGSLSANTQQTPQCRVRTREPRRTAFAGRMGQGRGFRAESPKRQSSPKVVGIKVATSIADCVRQYVFATYVVPARQKGFDRATVRAGDVAKATRLKTRIAAVCDVLQGITFQKEFGIKLLEKNGSRWGGHALFTFQV